MSPPESVASVAEEGASGAESPAPGSTEEDSLDPGGSPAVGSVEVGPVETDSEGVAASLVGVSGGVVDTGGESVPPVEGVVPPVESVPPVEGVVPPVESVPPV
ncbi:hypothetical protein ACFY0T_21655, partial [Streptomyces sp. NPDC001530]